MALTLIALFCGLLFGQIVVPQGAEFGVLLQIDQIAAVKIIGEGRGGEVAVAQCHRRGHHHGRDDRSR